MNAHVLKWIRWQHYWAVRQGRQFAQLLWATEYQAELAFLNHARNEAKPNDHKPKDISSAYDTISKDELHMEHK